MKEKLSIKLGLTIVLFCVGHFLVNHHNAFATNSFINTGNVKLKFSNKDDINIPIPEDYINEASDEDINDNEISENEELLDAKQDEEVSINPDSASSIDEANNDSNNNLDDNENTKLEEEVVEETLSQAIASHNDNPLAEDTNTSDNLFENFVENEAKMLFIHDDDVVLGEITKDGLFEVMEYNKYAGMILEDIKKKRKEYQANKLSNYIKNYDKNYHNRTVNNLTQDIKLSLSELFESARISIAKNDLRSLQQLVYASDELMYFRNINGYGLLDYALSQNQYIIVKWLVLNKYPIAINDKNLLTAISSLSYKMNDHYNMKYILNNAVQYSINYPTKLEY